MPMSDVLGVLADEIAEAAAPMAETFADLAQSDEEGARLIAVELYLEPVRRIMSAAEILAFAGLEQVCRHLDDNAVKLAGTGAVSEATTAVFLAWPEAVSAYLHAPLDPGAPQRLIDYLSDLAWPLPLGTVDAPSLHAALSSVPLSDDEEPTEPAPEMEDVSLVPDPRANPRVVDAFLTEGATGAAHYSDLVRGFMRGEHGLEALQEARRVVHTLKGAANTVGVRGVAVLAHRVEDVLEALALAARPPGGDVAETLLDVADCLEMMFDSLIHGHPEPPQALDVLRRLVALRVDAQPQTTPVTERQETAPAENRPSIEQRIPVPVSRMDELLRIASDITVGQAQVRDGLRHALRGLDELRQHATVLSMRAGEVERALFVGGLKPQGTARAGFDALELDTYPELHGHLYAVVEGASDIHTLGRQVRDLVSAVEATLAGAGERGKELHDSLVQARMIPASTVATRLERIVDHTAASLGKEARVDLTGADVMLDAQILKDLLDPLAHLVRNAVDHGLEPPADRRTLGKAPQGTIAVSFARAGNEIEITVEDDGRGLDLTRIRVQAEANGLLSRGATLTDDALARLIFASGLSTAPAVSYTSGRGVGLDVVDAQVRKLKGRIDIVSRPGAGCRFTLRFPVTLGLAHCLLARVGDHVVAVPSESMERAVYRGAAQVSRADEAWSYKDEGGTCEARDLSALLGYGGSATDDDLRSVILVNDGVRKTALLVDALLEGADLVIKNPGPFLAAVRGLAGASLLPDGRVVPVLDIVSLLRGPHVAPAVAVPSAPAAPVAARDILVVDDSLTVRNALSELLSAHGYAVRTARDGLEALELVQAAAPALVILDLEMPRMNGLELAAHLRSNTDTRLLPLILITSRSSAKHRTQAELAGIDLYLTKPYLDGELLGHLRRFLRAA